MELLTGEIMCRDMQEIEADDVLKFKEFMLVFYGAAWSQKSKDIAEAISTILVDLNPENEDAQQNIEAVYVSNDRSREEYSDFMKQCNEEVTWCSLPWNDEKVFEVKKAYNFDSLPQVLVLDKNLEIITNQGADDLMNLPPQELRSYWITELRAKIARAKEERE